MKKNALNEIKKTEMPALRAKIKDAKKELINLQFDKENQKLKDLKAVYKKRKDIAQMMTILKQKEILEKLEAKVQMNSVDQKISEPVKSEEKSKKKVKKEKK